MKSPPEKPNLDVRIARSEAERDAIFGLRYQVLVGELGGDSVSADHALKMIREPADAGGMQIYVQSGGKPVAAMRLNAGDFRALPPEVAQGFQLDRFAEFGEAALAMTARLTVSGSWRGSPATAMLLAAAYKLARRQGCRFDFTAVPPSLVRLYEQLGYRRYGENFVDEDETYRVPMVLVLEDLQHLAEIGSPFARIGRQMDNPRETALWFARTFPDAAGRLGTRLLDEDNFWQHMVERLNQPPMHGLPLLAGLAYADARRFLKTGGILRCSEGHRVVRQGDVGREMFVLLAGEVEVRYPTAGGSRPVARFGRGAVFGEIAWLADTPRTADVVAASDIEVLVLTQETMRRAMTQMPEIAARVLFNMSLILCERLRASTQGWMGQG